MRKSPGTARLCAAAFIAFAGAADAQTAASYPNKPVRMIVPYPAGGSTLTSSRTFSEKLNQYTGQPFVVENRPGASTIIGTQAVARSAPDGYTILLTSATVVLNHWAQENMPYDLVKDLVGVSTLVSTNNMVAIHPAIPASNLKELIAYARDKPGELHAAIQPGSHGHLQMLLLMQTTGTKITLVPYKGAASAVADLVSGRLQFAQTNPGTVISNLRAGKLRGIAMSGDRRAAILPDVPTFSEAGLNNYASKNWHIMLAPAATSRDILEKLNAYLNRAQDSKDVQEILEKAELEMFPNNLASTNAYLRSQIEAYGKVIKENNFKAGSE